MTLPFAATPPRRPGSDVLADLHEVDRRSLHWGPLRRTQHPDETEAEVLASFHYELLSGISLASDVAEGTRRTFEDLRKIWLYGLLCYEIFTLVGDRCLFLLEQALRDRFMEYYQGGVRWYEYKTGAEHVLNPQRYDDVMDFINANRRKYALVLGSDHERIPFTGMLGSLLLWAQSTGLLPGQRNRNIQKALSDLRNLAAHPGGYHLVGPNEAIGELRDVAEIVNRLWGHRTPGGRLYGDAIPREVVVIAWHSDHSRQLVTRATNLLKSDDDPSGWQYMIVRAYFDDARRVSDPELLFFDGQYEATRWPSEWLWGPGERADANEWYAKNKPEPDEVDYMDRDFLVRHDNGRLYLPMNPSVAAGVDSENQTGTWFLVRADHPNNAFHHVRSLLTGAPCDERTICGSCRALPIGRGNLADLLAHLAVRSASYVPSTARVPNAGRRYYDLH